MSGCQQFQSKKMEPVQKYTNALIHETSPYLLQHAHNPVNWYAWNDAAWERAKKEDKLVLVSIGYSSCHWCHVMEHETFEDTSAALLMNDYFVCIKVDREERPDVDQVYMTAVQLMTGGGGWPLNCICLPDGRPIYGGTYFQNAQWKELLIKLHEFYKNNKTQAGQYADELIQGIRQSELVKKNKDDADFSKDTLDALVENWKKYFDTVEGGPDRAPKFPMPNNYEFLMHYSAPLPPKGGIERSAIESRNREIQKYVLLTLNKMAYGGIYDQLGGGFARYSTDSLWKAPHFEKMLYDNAQLVSLYSHAYQLAGKKLYKDIVYETLEFVSQEMTSDEGGFYSALDADSEGEEGRFYVWNKRELEEILGNDFGVFSEYYNVKKNEEWEQGNYILLRKKSDEEVAKEFSVSVDELKSKITVAKQKLLIERSKRVRPELDDKQLTSWNMLMTKGYCDAYESFGERKFLDAAVRNANLILTKLKRSDGGLNHSYKKGEARINGYLEDYSLSIEAFVKLYEVTFEEKWLNEAKQLAEYSIKHFYDEQTGMLWFTSDLDPPLITGKKEINDNVIPASNSSMAKGLFLLGKYFDDKNYLSISATMLNNVKNDMARYPSGYSNWAELMLWHTEPFFEIVIAGKDAERLRKELTTHYLPNKILAGTKDDSGKLPLLESRFVKDETLIYVCQNYTCKLPIKTVEEAMKEINNER